MTVSGVIQARMGSSRLPGKSLDEIAGIPLLKRVIDRARRMTFLDTVCVATTTASGDDVLAEYVRGLGVSCMRGDEQDVLGRFVQAAKGLGPQDTVVRFTADNPLYDPAISAAAYGHHEEHEADYTYVRGLSHVVPEFVRVGALRAMAEATSDPYDREHVTPWLRADSAGMTALSLDPARLGLDPLAEPLLTVDTPADHRRLNRVLRELEGESGSLSLDSVYTWLRTHPQP